MNRSFLTCLILCLVYIRIGCSCFHHGHGRGHRHFWHHNHHSTPTGSTAEVIESFNNADRAIKNLCAATSKVQPFITYQDDGCILKYPVSSTDVNVDIQITDTVLKTSVTNKNDGQEVFTDVRVLPDILNFSEASWWLLNGNLIILIPYKVPLNSEFRASCGIVNSNVISVPLVAALKFEYRSNLDN